MSSNIDKIQQKALLEIRPTVNRTGRPKLVPYNDRYNYTGFTSVYGYTEAAAGHIENTNSTRGLSQFPVYSDVLYVDFDNNEEAAEQFKVLTLEAQGYTFDMYHSGGRSIHFHIPIEPMYGLNVPHSQKLWMESNAPEADMSIYRHSGLYRLPGTYHAKNPGKKKDLICKHDGMYTLRIENRPRVAVSTIDDEVAEKGEAYFHDILGKLLNTTIASGGRHPHAYKITMAARSSGKDETYARRLLGMWNNDNCHPPKEDWELDKLIKWVYSDA